MANSIKIQEKELKVLIVQNNPILMKKSQNIKKCLELIQKFSAQDKIDIVMFPEMSFTGYNFQNYNHALTMAVQQNLGQDFQFTKSIAQKLGSYVIFGYIQKVKNNSPKKLNTQNLIKQNKLNSLQQFTLFNAGAVINRNGEFILNFHKTHLYNCDQLWAAEGEGFKYIQIKNTHGQSFNCALGICMDINQKNFTSNKFQWADFVNQVKAQVLFFLSNWTDSHPQKNTEQQALNIYNYWLYRLQPVLKQKNNKKVLFVCDRVGKQFNYCEKQYGYFHGNSGFEQIQKIIKCNNDKGQTSNKQMKLNVYDQFNSFDYKVILKQIDQIN